MPAIIMENKKIRKPHKIALAFFGIMLILFGITAFFNAFYFGKPYLIFWICYLSLIIIGIGLIARKTFLIKSQLYILAIPDMIWVIDFISIIIFQKSVFGVADYFFSSGPLLAKIVSVQHIFVIPIIFYAVAVLKFKKEQSWKISLIQLILFYFASLVFTPPSANINCAHSSCVGILNFQTPFYPLIWFALSFLMVYVSRAIFISVQGFMSKMIRHKNGKIYMQRFKS